MKMVNPAAFAEIPDGTAIFIILAAFTVSFVSCGIITYRIIRKKNNKKDKD